MTQWELAFANIIWWLTLWAFLEYFWISSETLIILSVMLLLDWIFGVVDAYIQGNLKSKIMWLWLVKKLTRWCFPFIVIGVLRWAWFSSTELIATVMLSIMIVAEGYSIIWHIYTINYKQELPEIDALKLLFQWIAKIFKEKVDESLKDEDLDSKKEWWDETTL